MAANPNPPANPSADPNPPANPPAGAQNTDPPAGDQPAANPPAEPMIPKSRFDEINNKFKALEREKREREDAAAQAEAERAKAQGEWQALAEKHEAKAKSLEPFKEKAERYETALTAILETERKDLPTHITALLDRMDPAEQLEYIAANRDVLKPAAAAAANGTANGAANGNGHSAVPPSPKADNGKALSDQERKDAQALESQRYRLRF